MNDSPTPTATVDLLNALFDAEQNSILRFIDEGSPYLGQAGTELRRTLHELVRASERHASLLGQAIDGLGGTPAPRGVQREEQYMAFLSLKFLIPKLIEAKKIAIERYENALHSLSAPAEAAAGTEVIALLQSLLAEHRDHLKVLQKSTADVSSAK